MPRRSRQKVIIRLLRLFFAHDPAQMLANGNRIRMPRTKNLLANAECPLAKGLCLCIATLRKEELCQVVESFCSSEMLSSMGLLNNGEALLPKRFGPLIISLFIRK